jgi:hypothetical protein
MSDFTIIPTLVFQRNTKPFLKKYPSFKSDLKELIQSLKENPRQGDGLGKDCYKVRLKIASKVKGKRSGARVITCVKVVNQTIYLVNIFDKSERENITKTELISILKEAGLE